MAGAATHGAEATAVPGQRGRRQLADFRADPRLLLLAAMALVIGTGGAFAALVLVKLIALVTNLVWFGALDTVTRPMALALRGHLSAAERRRCSWRAPPPA